MIQNLDSIADSIATQNEESEVALLIATQQFHSNVAIAQRRMERNARNGKPSIYTLHSVTHEGVDLGNLPVVCVVCGSMIAANAKRDDLAAKFGQTFVIYTTHKANA